MKSKLLFFFFQFTNSLNNTVINALDDFEMLNNSLTIENSVTYNHNNDFIINIFLKTILIFVLFITFVRSL